MTPAAGWIKHSTATFCRCATRAAGNSSTIIDGRSKTVFAHLTAIQRRDEPVGTDDYQGRLPIKWSDFNFAHIPIGLLSQVYEAFCWKCETQLAEDMSIHYTPRHIAATLVDEVFDSLPNAHKSRVLDASCGAGVFLVLAFRRLYRERWAATGKRPGTKEIRDILYRQLTGFDISDSALKLSALSLYLTAIELDPEPIPPSKLGFKKLNNRVLFDHRRPERSTGGLGHRQPRRSCKWGVCREIRCGDWQSAVDDAEEEAQKTGAST